MGKRRRNALGFGYREGRAAEQRIPSTRANWRLTNTQFLRHAAEI